MKEFDLIAHLAAGLNSTPRVLRGAGDDCAVLLPPGPSPSPSTGTLPQRLLSLLKTDAVVEGIHFTSDAEPHRVGHKALGRCLSDIAAMGGTPVAAVVTLGLSTSTPFPWIDGVYRGLNALARQFDVAIVGGETTTLPERRFLSVSVTGEVPEPHLMLRTGARPGDALFVTGELGGSIEGHHLDFIPRVREGQWLARTGWVTSMIDVSDGLAGDLAHLLGQSPLAGTRSPGMAPDLPRLGADIHADCIPIRRAARERARLGDLARPALAAALTDGEDFELLFSVMPGKSVALLDGWKEAFPTVPLRCIGRVTDQTGLRLRDRTGWRPLPGTGYQHIVPPLPDPLS